MRVTVELDDEIYALVKTHAQACAVTLGKALNQLVLKGIAAPLKTRRVNGLVVVDLPEDSEIVTSEKVKKLQNEGW